MAISDFDIGCTEIKKLAMSFRSQGPNLRNEATTRLHLIDRIFFDVLQWPRDQCVLEKSHEGTYVDYEFGVPRGQMIVEAKKEGLHFELPLDKASREVSLPSLVRRDGNLDAALRQVGSYCTTRGVPIAVACNGHQLVAFIGSRVDGIPPTAGKAIIFRSIEEMLEDFITLWNCLGYAAAERRYLESRLIGESLPPAPEKLARRIIYYPGVKRRNDLEHELRILGEIFLQDLVKDPDMEPFPS